VRCRIDSQVGAKDAAILRQACRTGLGIVSKRLSAPYRSGPSRDWVKIKSPEAQQ
jgi:bifunctional non-homologous end joining protein LigD